MIELDLRDIHLPEGLSWWPLAPGWWFSLAVVILLAGLIWWLWRRLRNPLKQASLRELSRLRDAHVAGAAASQILAETSMLLRRIAISRRGRAQAAGLTGDAWRACVEEISGDCRLDRAQLDLLTRSRFQTDPDCDIDELLRRCENWVRRLPREGKHVSV